jgi:hypothetical protein
MRGLANEANEAVPAKKRLSTSWRLFAIGLALVLFGFGLNFWFYERSKTSTFHLNGDNTFAGCILILGLVFWVVTPFFSKRPFWVKIGLSLLSIVLWSLAGYYYQAFH